MRFPPLFIIEMLKRDDGMSRDLLAPLRAAVDTYGMIQDGDRVAVGVSGGKDSMTLLSLLAGLRRFYPNRFTLTAITLDPCFDGKQTDYSAVEGLCRKLEIPYILKRTQLWETVKEHMRDETPCSFCARLRRGALHLAAKNADCNVVALGHHQNDAAETVLMNLLSGATLGCFSPKAYLDRSGLTLIRPMIYLTEREIAAYAAREELPVVKSLCPAEGNTHRARVKELLVDLSAAYGDVDRKITDALKKAGLDGW